MSGELWLGQVQVGVETVYGTAVPATRIMYTKEPFVNPNAETEFHDFMTGTRDNVRAATIGPKRPIGQITMDMSYDELIELLLVTIKGGVTPSTTIWTFAPGNSVPDSMTMEWFDGVTAWIASGVYGDRMKISGDAGGRNTVTVDLVAKDVVSGTMTGSLTGRTPNFSMGRETRLWIDAFAGTPKTTQKTNLLVNWDITIMNNIGEKFFANNENAVGGRPFGVLGFEATLTFEAAAAQSATEITNFLAATKRLLALRFGQDAAYVDLYMPGAWQSIDLGKNDKGTRTYEMRYRYITDPTNGFGLQAKLKNARSAAW